MDLFSPSGGRTELILIEMLHLQSLKENTEEGQEYFEDQLVVEVQKWRKN